MTTPSTRLAKRLIDRLVAARLLAADDAERLTPRLITGTATAEDWSLAVEKAAEQRTQ